MRPADTWKAAQAWWGGLVTPLDADNSVPLGLCSYWSLCLDSVLTLTPHPHLFFILLLQWNLPSLPQRELAISAFSHL